jgi:hypothetical protein
MPHHQENMTPRLTKPTPRLTKPKNLRASAADPPPPSEVPPFTMSPRKIALIAVDWLDSYEEETTERDDWEQPGFHPLFSGIAQLCDQAGCDTILYALFSHSEYKHGALKRQDLFGRQPKNLQWIILEVSRDKSKHDNITLVWERTQSKPHTLVQRLARGHDEKGKHALMKDLSGRTFGSTMLLLCGEVGIINTQRGSNEIADKHGFLETLHEKGIQVILNPGHTFIRRHEVPKKREALSEDNRWLLSVWNRGWHERGPQGKVPWQVFYGGHEAHVTELPHELGADIRIGIVELSPAGQI